MVIKSKSLPPQKPVIKNVIDYSKRECLINLLHSTKEYLEVCEDCKDMVSPRHGKTDFTDEEINIIALRTIIRKLRNVEQECEDLKKRNESLRFPQKDTQFAILNEKEFEEYKLCKHILQYLKEVLK